MINRNDLINKTISLLQKVKRRESLQMASPFSKEIKFPENVSFGDYTYGQPVVYHGENQRS